MIEDIELTQILDVIYGAAMRPVLWNDALRKIADFVGGEAGALGAQDAVSRFINGGDEVGQDLQYLDLQCMRILASDREGRANLATTAPLDSGQVETVSAFTPSDDDGTTRQFRSSGAAVEESKQVCAFDSAVRSRASDETDLKMRRRMALIAPHLRRAALMRRTIDQKVDEATTFAGIFDNLSAGLFLIDAAGHIVHANAAGRGILATDDFLRSIGGRLTARDAKINRTLHAAFADRNALEIRGNGTTLPLSAEDGQCHVAHILSLGRATRSRTGVQSTVVAAVLVCRAVLEIPSSPEILQRAYHLTPTELRVLLAIVDVGGIPQVATALGVADSTIKTHVGRLFAKTGVGRQADLVKLVAGFCTPLVA